MFAICRCVRCEQTFINVSMSCDCSSPNILVSRGTLIALKFRKMKSCVEKYKCFHFKISFLFQSGGLCFSARESLPPKGIATVRFGQVVSIFILKRFQAVSSKSFKFSSWKTKVVVCCPVAAIVR